MQRDDIDPYGTGIIEDLLSSQQEWKNINDIIRLTFKALTDVVKTQGESLREMEKQLSTRASKNELHTGLSLKANINDISRTIAEVANNLDTKISYEDAQTIFKDYILKADLQYLLSKQLQSLSYSKVDIDEVRALIEKSSSQELKQEFIYLKQRVEDSHSQLSKKLQQLPSLKEFSQLSQAVELKANLQEMNEVLETKASKHQVQQAINKKISRQDLDSILQNYSSLEDIQPIIQSLDQKASLDQIDKIASILEMKVDRTDFTILINSLQQKTDILMHEQLKDQIQEFKISVDSKLQEVQSQSLDQKAHQEQVQKTVSKKVDINSFDKFNNQFQNLATEYEQLQQKIQKIQQDFHSDQQRLRNELLESKQFTSEQMQTTIMKTSHMSEKVTEELYNLSENLKLSEDERISEFEEFKKQINKILTQKRDLQIKIDTIQEQLEENKSDNPLKAVQKQIASIQKEINELKAKVLSQDDEHQLQSQIEQQLQRKVNEIKKSSSGGDKTFKNEITKVVANKITQFEQQLSQFESTIRQRVLYQDFDELKNIIQKLCIDQDERAYSKDVQKHIQLTKYTLDLIQKDLMMKASVQDVCQLLDSKANIPEINGALENIHKELTNKVSADDLANFLKNQNQVYESLCQENILARFQWRSGDLNNKLIPWEYEVINTLPENFIWEKNKTSILIVAPGVYHVTYAFFAKDKQSAQLIVNNDVIHTQEVKKKSELGLSFSEFIVLPNRARIQINYTGVKGEGFISLKRL